MLVLLLISKGRTPLHEAASKGSIGLCGELIKGGAKTKLKCEVRYCIILFMSYAEELLVQFN